jgi:hypothetical protein
MLVWSVYLASKGDLKLIVRNCMYLLGNMHLRRCQTHRGTRQSAALIVLFFACLFCFACFSKTKKI